METIANSGSMKPFRLVLQIPLLPGICWSSKIIMLDSSIKSFRIPLFPWTKVLFTYLKAPFVIILPATVWKVCH